MTRISWTALFVSGVWATTAFALEEQAATAEAENDVEGAFEDEELPDGWSVGPLTGALGSQAEIEVPEGFLHLNGPAAMAQMEAMENPRSGNEVGLLMPYTDENQFMVLFEYEDVGFIKDDDKDELDAGELLDSFKEGTEASNENRRAQGWEEIEITGWAQPPHYDEASNNLVWAIQGRGLGPDGEPFVNYNVRLLGRRGYMSATVICSPDDLKESTAKAESMLRGFRYTSGNTYAEYVEGDKLAEFGLMGLMVGGGAVLAFPLLRKLWKFILIGVVAAGGFLRKLFFGEKMSKKES